MQERGLGEQGREVGVLVKHEGGLVRGSTADAAVAEERRVLIHGALEV